MPTKAKADPTVEETTSVVDTEASAADEQVRPKHAGEICPEGCGVLVLDPSATHFACEHGSWDLSDTAA